MDSNYTYVNIFKPRCSKCKNEINEFNLSLAYWCNCDNEKEKIWNNSFIPSKNKHLSDIYKNIEFTKPVRHKIKKKIEENISIFISKIKYLIKKIITNKFTSKLNLFNFSKKSYIDDDIYIKGNEQKIPFFNEEYSEKIVDLVKNLNSSKLEQNTLNDLKTFILDIHFFILILKKNPLVSQKIIFQNVYTKYDQNYHDDSIYDYNIQFQDILKYYFSKDNNKYCSTAKLVQIFPIIEKNIILFIYTDYIKIYNFILNNFVFDAKAKNKKSKICKIDPENLVSLGYSTLYFSKIEYDSMNNPIKYYYFDCIKSASVIIDFDIINKNNIVYIDELNNIHLLNIFFTENNIIYNISRTETINYNYYDNFILADKINKQIVLCSEKIKYDDYSYNYYYSKRDHVCFLKLYDINLIPKNKMFKFEERESFYTYSRDITEACKLKYLNSDLYILFFFQKIYLISSKYLEIVSVYDLSSYSDDSLEKINFIYYKFIILEKSKNIILYKEFKEFIFKLFNNEIINDEKKIWFPLIYNIKFFDIIEINEKGDFLIIFFTEDNRLKLYYINKKQEESIFIKKKKDELKGKNQAGQTIETDDDEWNLDNFDFDYFDEVFSKDENFYGIPCPTCSFGWPICSDNDSTLNSEIRKKKI